jgi:hypothetical protein
MVGDHAACLRRLQAGGDFGGQATIPLGVHPNDDTNLCGFSLLGKQGSRSVWERIHGVMARPGVERVAVGIPSLGSSRQ